MSLRVSCSIKCLIATQRSALACLYRRTFWWCPADRTPSSPAVLTTPVTQANLSSNGNLQFGTLDNGSFNQSFPYATSMIAPFWEDLLIPPGDVRYNNTVANQFTAIWNNTGLFLVPGETIAAEAILLRAGNGFGYAANSILFGYGAITSTKDNSITVGLTDGTHSTCLPGSAADCTFTQTQAVALQNRTFLFTPVIGDTPSYSVSELNATPEPSVFLLSGLGLLVIGGLRAKRASKA